MDFEYSWEEMKRWLDKGIKHLESKEKEIFKTIEETGAKEERKRIKGKLEGLMICRGYMEQIERKK